MFCPPKNIQPFDLNDDPFIVEGRKLLDSMRIQVASLGKVMSDGVHKAACYDLIFLFFSPELCTDLYCEFLIDSLSSNRYFYPPVEAQRHGEKLIELSFFENWQYCEEKPKMRIWGKDEALQKLEQIKIYLNSELEKFYLKRFTF